MVARTKAGGLTAASLATTITTGQAALGLTAATITTEALSSDTITFNTAAPTLIVAGSLIHISGASNPNFDGWFLVATMPTSQQGTLTKTSIDSRGIGWQFGDSASSSGGTIGYYLSNHLTWTAVTNAWEYYIYMQFGGAGSYSLIGQTKPSANTWIDAEFDDYGATFMANQTFPAYVPSTAPSSATNDPLTTTIVSGAGTTSIVVANAASQTISGQTAYFDDGPAILAAATASASSAGTVYIPPGPAGSLYYPVYSFTQLPAAINIKQSGVLALYETLALSNVTNWLGDWSNPSAPQFSFAGTAQVYVQTANPGIYAYLSNIVTSYVSFLSSGTNGGVLWLSEDAISGEFEYDNFVANQNNVSDYLSTPVIFRSTSTGGNNFHFRKTLFSAGPSQVLDKSWTPLVYFPPNQNGSGGLLNNQNYFVRCMECFVNRRGFEEEMAAGIAGRFEFDGGYRQGGITPFLSIGNSSGTVNGSLMFHNLIQDSEAAGTLALWGGFSGLAVDATFVANSSVDTNGVPPPFIGVRPPIAHELGSTTGTVPNRGNELTFSTNCAVAYPYEITGTNICAAETFKKYMEAVDFPSGNSLFWDLGTPTSVTVGAATNGGSLTAGTYYYTVSATGPDGGETVPSTVAASGTTATTNLTLPVSWTGIAGAVNYNVYRCTAPAANCVYSDGRIANLGNWKQIARQTAAASLSDTGLTGTQQAPPAMTGTGAIGINPTQIYAPEFDLMSALAAGISYKGRFIQPTLTANRSYTAPDATGTLSLGIVEFCGATSGGTQACAKTVQTNPIVVFGDVTLNTATTQAITTLPFTAAADYSCSGSDLTTAAGVVSFSAYTSGAQATIQETGGANTDHLRYMCVGF